MAIFTMQKYDIFSNYQSFSVENSTGLFSIPVHRTLSTLPIFFFSVPWAVGTDTTVPSLFSPLRQRFLLKKSWRGIMF